SLEEPLRLVQRWRQLLLADPPLHRRLETGPQRLAEQRRTVRIAVVGEARDQGAAGVDDRAERADERPAGLLLPVGADPVEAERSQQRVERLFPHGAVDAPDAKLGVAPPEPALQLLPSLRRNPLLGDRPQQRLGAVERGQAFIFFALLHAPDGVGGELTDLGAGRGGAHLANRGLHGRWTVFVGLRLAQQPARDVEVLALQHGIRRLFIRRPQRRARGAERVAQRLVVGGHGDPALEPRDGGAQDVDPLPRVTRAGLNAREQYLSRGEGEVSHVTLPRGPILGRRRHDRLLERSASAVDLALLLPSKPDEAPETRRLAGREPALCERGSGLALDERVLLALPQRVDPIR